MHHTVNLVSSHVVSRADEHRHTDRAVEGLIPSGRTPSPGPPPAAAGQSLVLDECTNNDLPPAERTVLTVRPAPLDVTVGESVVLSCQASHDPSMDVEFVWSFDGRVVDLKKDSAHFERIGGVSRRECEVLARLGQGFSPRGFA